MKSYLETNGTLPQELKKVIDLVDIIAMDIKLPSSTLDKPFWDEHTEFLKIASVKKVFVKAIVTGATTRDDIERTVSIVKKVNKRIPLILQPATPIRPEEKPVASDMMMGLLEIGLKHDFENIRIIPQVHKILDVK